MIAGMIGILIVSHGAFGESLIHSASHVLGKRPLYLRQLGVTVHDDPDAILPVGEDLIRFLDQGAGVLMLTDIFGATPSFAQFKEHRVEECFLPSLCGSYGKRRI